MISRLVASAVLCASLLTFGCGDDESADGGSGGAAATGGAGGAGGSGGMIALVDCDNLPDLTSYVVGDFYEVPTTATDDCTVMFEDGAMNSNRLNVVVDGANPGDVICIAPGTYTMEATITVAAVPGLTLKGTGASPDDTVLNFGGPGTGKGFLIQQDNVTVENMWIKNTGDNGVEQQEVTGSVFRKLHVSWDINGDNMSLNGAYAIYPTDCEDTLVEYNQTQGASDAGVYVGKCGWADDTTPGGLVQYNVVHENVLGLEVENSLDVEVHNNTIVNNTTGLFSFQTPDVGAQTPSNMNILWRDNDIYCNNHPNFAATGAAQIAPPGTGGLVISGDGQEFRNNNIQNNVTGGFVIVSNTFVCQAAPPEQCTTYAGYVPYSINLYFHDNFFAGNGEGPQGDFGAIFLAAGVGTPENPVEDVFWDGYVYPDAPNGDPGICLGADNTASYRDLTNNQCAGLDLGALLICISDNTITDTTGRLCDPPL